MKTKMEEDLRVKLETLVKEYIETRIEDESDRDSCIRELDKDVRRLVNSAHKLSGPTYWGVSETRGVVT